MSYLKLYNRLVCKPLKNSVEIFNLVQEDKIEEVYEEDICPYCGGDMEE